MFFHRGSFREAETSCRSAQMWSFTAAFIDFQYLPEAASVVIRVKALITIRERKLAELDCVQVCAQAVQITRRACKSVQVVQSL